MANFHGIAPATYLYCRARENCDALTTSQLAISYHSAVRRHLIAMKDLSFLARTFAPLPSPWLVMKGPVLSEVVYQRPDLRSYIDLDVVVPGECLGSALKLLEAAGSSVIDNDWQVLTGALRGELRVLLPSGTLLDLHWHLLSHRGLRDDFSISMKGLFARRRVVPLGGQEVATLDSVDTVVHLAIHSCLAGGNRLVWMKDLEQCILRQRFSWAEVVHRAHEWSAGPLVATQLARTMRIFRLDVPSEVLGELAGNRLWPLVIGGLDRVAPVERTYGRRSVGRLVSRGTRADLASSVWEYGRRITAWLRGGAPTGLPSAELPSDVRISMAVGKRQSERQAFLHAVAQAESGSKA